MDPITVFTDNLFSFARMLGTMPGGWVLSGPSGSIAAASGLPYAGENYLLLRPEATVFETERLIGFFTARSLPFVTPELPGTPQRLISALEALNILPVNVYTAMTMELTQAWCREPSLVSVHGETDEWAHTAWEGFGGEAEMPEEYPTLARHLAGCQENTLYVLKEGGQSLSCGLLHYTKDSCGLYYFATPPIFRRHGYALRLMTGLAGEAAVRGREMVLLATPEGLPLYLNFGFKVLTEITMRSNVTDL